MRFSGAPCFAGVVRVEERVFLGVGVVVVMNGFSFSSVSLSTTRLFAGVSVSMVLRVRFPKSISAIATTLLDGKEAAWLAGAAVLVVA